MKHIYLFLLLIPIFFLAGCTKSDVYIWDSTDVNADANGVFVPYSGALYDVDLNNHKIIAGQGSQFGDGTRYAVIDLFNLPIGTYPIMKGVSDGFFGNLPPMMDRYLILVDSAGGTVSCVAMTDSVLLDLGSICFDTTTGVFSFDKSISVTGTITGTTFTDGVAQLTAGNFQTTGTVSSGFNSPSGDWAGAGDYCQVEPVDMSAFGYSATQPVIKCYAGFGISAVIVNQLAIATNGTPMITFANTSTGGFAFLQLDPDTNELAFIGRANFTNFMSENYGDMNMANTLRIGVINLNNGMALGSTSRMTFNVSARGKGFGFLDFARGYDGGNITVTTVNDNNVTPKSKMQFWTFDGSITPYPDLNKLSRNNMTMWWDGNVDFNKNVYIPNNLTLSNDLLLKDGGRVKKEVRLDVYQTAKGASAPTQALRAVGASGGVLLPVVQFSKTTQQDVYFEVHAPEDIDNDVNVSFNLMWQAGAAYTSGNYVWKVEFLIKDENGASTATGTPETISADITPPDATTVLETKFTQTINLNAQQVMWAHFYRDVASDNGDDVGSCRWAEIEYTSNKLGEEI